MKLIRITHEVWTHNGEIYLPVTVIQRMAKKIDQKPKAEITLLPEDAPPEEWRFDDNTRMVNIGGGQIVKFSRLEYGLLKFVAKGGTNIQKAWQQVWEYQSPAEWRVMKHTAVRISKKLEQYSRPFKVIVNTREVKIIPTEISI